MMILHRSTYRVAAAGPSNGNRCEVFSGFLGRSFARHGGRVCNRSRPGAAIVETSIVLSLFFLFVLAMIEMAQLGMANQLLTSAVRSGARVGVIPGNTSTDVAATVQNLLNSGGITTYTLTITPSDVTTTKLGDPITVTVTTAFSNISWLSNPLYLGSVTLSASSTLTSEYP